MSAKHAAALVVALAPKTQTYYSNYCWCKPHQQIKANLNAAGIHQACYVADLKHVCTPTYRASQAPKCTMRQVVPYWAMYYPCERAPHDVLPVLQGATRQTQTMTRNFREGLCTRDQSKLSVDCTAGAGNRRQWQHNSNIFMPRAAQGTPVRPAAHRDSSTS